MTAEQKTTKKYNVAISKLFEVVINLGEEQQEALLHYAEELLIKEKRSGIRKPCSIPISYAAYDRVFSNHIKNISPYGLFIETQRPLLVGDEIVMTFRPDGFDKAFKVRGEIAHANRSGVGVEFKDISPYIEEMLRNVIKGMG